MKKIKSITVKIEEDNYIKYDKNSFKPNKTTFKKKKDKIIMTEHIILKDNSLYPIEFEFNINDIIKIER